jgi:hypothetical protein
VRLLAFNVGPTVSAKRSSTRTRPGKTSAHSHNASISAEYGNLQCPRTIIFSGHIRHVGRDARAHYFTRIYHVAHNDRYDHDDHDYPNKIFSGYNGYNHT